MYYNSESLQSQQCRGESLSQQPRQQMRAKVTSQAYQPQQQMREDQQVPFGGYDLQSNDNNYNNDYNNNTNDNITYNNFSNSQLPYHQSYQQQQQNAPHMRECTEPVVIHNAALLARFKNDPNPAFDLGKDGAFGEFRVLFYGCYDSNTYGYNTLRPALMKKGFQVTWHTTQHEFLEELRKSNAKEIPPFDVVGFTSTESSQGDDSDFTTLIKEAHQNGTGLFIFADNQPFTYQANLVLPEIAGCIVMGDDLGTQTLVFGSPEEPGRFDQNHLVFSGINSLYEGITICYPCPVRLPGKEEDEVNRLQTLATSTYDRPVISKMEASDDHGRVIVDTGFTKLADSYWGGQERYVVNACVWLTNIEKRYGTQEPQALKH